MYCSRYMNGVKPWQIKLQRIYRPYEKVLMIEEHEKTLDDGNFHPNFPLMPNLLATRHGTRRDTDNGLGNVIFCDGHADTVTRAYVKDPRNYDPREP